MADWFAPVQVVGDIIVVGERHRERSSRKLIREVLDSYEISSVCVEAGPDMGYRDDGGGAIGKALVFAEENDIPRYYVDCRNSKVIDAFGSRLRAYSYLKSIEEDYPDHKAGLLEREKIEEIRDNFRQEHGNEKFEAIYLEREENMAGRALWADQQNTGGKTLLVVGGAHFERIVKLLATSSVDPIEIERSRLRENERIVTGNDPFTLAFAMIARSVEDVDWSAYWEKLPSIRGLYQKHVRVRLDSL